MNSIHRTWNHNQKRGKTLTHHFFGTFFLLLDDSLMCPGRIRAYNFVIVHSMFSRSQGTSMFNLLWKVRSVVRALLMSSASPTGTRLSKPAIPILSVMYYFCMIRTPQSRGLKLAAHETSKWVINQQVNVICALSLSMSCVNLTWMNPRVSPEPNQLFQQHYFMPFYQVREPVAGAIPVLLLHTQALRIMRFLNRVCVGNAIHIYSDNGLIFIA